MANCVDPLATARNHTSIGQKRARGAHDRIECEPVRWLDAIGIASPCIRDYGLTALRFPGQYSEPVCGPALAFDSPHAAEPPLVNCQ